MPAVGLTGLPPAASLRGYAFVELAADGMLGRAAERLLESLGFRRGGRHRSKPVELRQQGAARVLVNRSGPPAARRCRRGRAGRAERRPGPVGPPGPRAAGQPDDGFDEATLFYQALLGMRAHGSDEVASTYGLVRSRPMLAPGGRVRLVLNAPLLGGLLYLPRRIDAGTGRPPVFSTH